MSAKRTVRNIDAASAANVIGEYLEVRTVVKLHGINLSISCQPSALLEILMPHSMLMLLVSTTYLEQSMHCTPNAQIEQVFLAMRRFVTPSVADP